VDSAGKKTAEAIQREVAKEVVRLLQVVLQGRRQRPTDLEAVETAVRSAMHRAGAAALSELLQVEEPAKEQRRRPCPCGRRARYRELRTRPLLTIVGEVELRRPYFLCRSCHQGQFPTDAELDVEHRDLSPGVRRMLALVGAQAPFDHGRQQMEVLAGLMVTTKAVERTAEEIGADIAAREQHEMQRARQLDLPMETADLIPILYVEMDGTGVPVVAAETAGRAGKVPGQSAHTREAKLGCVFTQTTFDEQGYPIRDPDSTTYTGAIATAESFDQRIYHEACRRGLNRAQKVVIIADGAEWIWNLADPAFPGAIQIVDLYHARQHLWDLARRLHPNDASRQNQWMLRHQPKLDAGKIENLVRFLHSLHPDTPELAAAIHREAAYFERNAERMRYPEFRRQHLFVGSGVMEAGCKTVIGARLKQSGMFWTVRGANAVIALRICCLNGQLENYWENRHAA
jgi:hypothetical protein